MKPSKRFPLVILHKNHVTGGPAQHPNNKKLLENWKNSGALFATPPASNDDWYWLYAVVSCKCLPGKHRCSVWAAAPASDAGTRRRRRCLRVCAASGIKKIIFSARLEKNQDPALSLFIFLAPLSHSLPSLFS